MNSLAVFIAKNNLNIIEGKIYSEQKRKISELLKNNKKINNILEIGFNAGHSADFFLSQRDDIKVTSVDINKHNYVIPCSNYISTKYPDRHNLILGDSREVLPQIKEKFDFIFIDGGHDDDIPEKDIINCRKLSKKHTIVMLDDYECYHGANVVKAFDKLVKEDFVIESEIPFRYGTRGWVLYKYV